MAISNFTNFLSTSVFSLFSLRTKHENNSCFFAQKKSELFVSLANSSALSMISRTYSFKQNIDNAVVKESRSLGNCRVVGVVINEIHCPELLLQNLESENSDFYPINDLVVSHEVIAIQ